MRRPHFGPGVVYIITCDCKHDGFPVKIGHTHYGGLHNRILTLQSGNHHQLEFFRIILNVLPAGEEWMLQRYKHLAIRGEWFTFDPDMLEVQIPAEFTDPPYPGQGIVDLPRNSYPKHKTKPTEPEKKELLRKIFPNR